VSVATENNRKLATMSRTLATGALDTIDALHQYLPPFDMGGNSTAVVGVEIVQRLLLGILQGCAD
jgi:hypothetical protein